MTLLFKQQQNTTRLRRTKPLQAWLKRQTPEENWSLGQLWEDGAARWLTHISISMDSVQHSMCNSSGLVFWELSILKKKNSFKFGWLSGSTPESTESWLLLLLEINFLMVLGIKPRAWGACSTTEPQAQPTTTSPWLFSLCVKCLNKPVATWNHASWLQVSASISLSLMLWTLWAAVTLQPPLLSSELLSMPSAGPHTLPSSRQFKAWSMDLLYIVALCLPPHGLAHSGTSFPILFRCHLTNKGIPAHLLLTHGTFLVPTSTPSILFFFLAFITTCFTYLLTYPVLLPVSAFKILAL